MSDRLLDQLIRDEGERLTPYKDSKGIWTIGVGHNCQASPITHVASRQILLDDVARIDNNLIKILPWITSLDDARKGVIRNLAFNMGMGEMGGEHGLLSLITFLGYMHDGNWQAAHNDLLKTKWASEVGERSTRLASQILTGVWQ